MLKLNYFFLLLKAYIGAMENSGCSFYDNFTPAFRILFLPCSMPFAHLVSFSYLTFLYAACLNIRNGFRGDMDMCKMVSPFFALIFSCQFGAAALTKIYCS